MLHWYTIRRWTMASRALSDTTLTSRVDTAGAGPGMLAGRLRTMQTVECLPEKGACAQIGTRATSWCDLGHDSRRTCERVYRFFFFSFRFLFFLCSSVPFLVSFCSFYFLSTDGCDRSGPGVEPVTRCHGIFHPPEFLSGGIVQTIPG